MDLKRIAAIASLSMLATGVLLNLPTACLAEVTEVANASGTTAAPAAPTPTDLMTEVKLNYKDGKYRDALEKLAGMPQTDVNHYYKGLCYQGQGQLQQAKTEYAWVAYYSKDPKMKANARRAIDAVSRYASARTYKGQGNYFAQRTAAAASSPAGGVVRRS